MSLFFKVLIVFLALAALSFVAALFGRSPGEVTLAWGGWRLDTSVGVLVLAIALFALAILLIAGLWRGTLALPGRRAATKALQQREAGFEAMTQGMVALAAGDAAEARRHAKRASELLGRPPGALLIGAQAAQMDGRPDLARKFYAAMTEQAETELLGLRGLVAIAEQEGDRAGALRHAERARELAPKTPWVLTRLFHLQIAARRWEAAEATLRQAIAQKAVGGEGTHQEAVILVQLSLMAERDGQRALAIDRAKRALHMAPEFLPAALQLAALLIAEGETRRARRTVETAWTRAPHPDLARLYGIASGESDSLKRYQALAALAATTPADRESHHALARAALEAKLWGEARRHVKAAGDPPDAGFCRLMAELEQSEHADAGKARDWLAKASDAEPEPAWLCRACGAQLKEWSALCGHCGGFDTVHWGTPPRVTRLAAPAAAPAAPSAVPGGPAAAPAPAPRSGAAPAALTPPPSAG